MEQFRKFFAHPAVPMILGAIIAFSGAGEVGVRSAGLLILGIWLTSDFWLLVTKRNWGRWKVVVGCAMTSFIFVVVMGLMWMAFRNDLRNQQEDVYQHLNAFVTIPPLVNPMASLFSVVNGSSHAIGWHQILCSVNIVVGNNRGTIIKNLNGNVNSFDGELHPGGDSQTDQCLSVFSFLLGMGTDCADVALIVKYILPNQAGMLREKNFRFVGVKSNDQFVWFPEPVGAHKEYCPGKPN